MEAVKQEETALGETAVPEQKDTMAQDFAGTGQMEDQASETVMAEGASDAEKDATGGNENMVTTSEEANLGHGEIKRVELCNRQFADVKELHAFLAAELELPSWYGKNLDALYDCLTELHDPVVIRIRWSWFQKPWFKAACQVIRDAAEVNPYIMVR